MMIDPIAYPIFSMVDESKVIRAVKSLKSILFPNGHAIVHINVVPLESYFRLAMRSLGDIFEHIIVEPIRKMVRPITVLFTYQLVGSL